MTPAAADWARAQRALAALAVDPGGLKGMVVRARPGPVRQSLDDGLAALPLPPHRIHPGLDDIRLFGGLNVAASLSAGHMIRDRGLAETPAALVLPMAERTPPGLTARLAQLLDADRGHALVMLDEGAEPEEAAPDALADRLAFHADLSALRAAEARLRLPAPADMDAARARLSDVTLPEGHAAQLAALAIRFGIDSLRAPLLALRCARALAALDGAATAGEAHLREAAELVYPARATQIPETEQDQTPDADNTPPDASGQQEDMEDPLAGLPDEILVEAVAACLPADLLGLLERRRMRKAPAGGSGAGRRRTGNRRGRPLPSRPGRPDGRARIDVVATLRSAAPWQPLRRRARADGPRLIIHPSDIRLRRFEDRSDRLIIFAVDASGSAAMARMAEAKGAVELLLAQAYSRRDQVAVVAFRGQAAEVLLPPTRSLVQAKRRLATLPGGGGTPLAAGLQIAFQLALSGQRNGFSPNLALLTDGRANIALDGTAGRGAAREDAEAMALHWSRLGLPAIVIDTATRPGAEGTALSQWLGARYLALPRADARRISAAADAALAS